ncbi:hypothetical protein ACH5RR_008854 [Cinchona calisaya]|uniref:Uncharacterized protein n=1 Tax=Cinchona calisaya TaxID=153742 RepID=A0ABD3AGD5_9GENT
MIYFLAVEETINLNRVSSIVSKEAFTSTINAANSNSIVLESNMMGSPVVVHQFDLQQSMHEQVMNDSMHNKLEAMNDSMHVVKLPIQNISMHGESLQVDVVKKVSPGFSNQNVVANIRQLGKALCDDQHSRFQKKKKKVIHRDEVIDSLSNLDEVARFPHARERLTGIFKTILKTL